MTAHHPNSGETRWIQRVTAYLRRAVPRRETGEWEHDFSSAYQMGVMALVGFGQAEETKSGAIELARPKLPDTSPRWDDTCCAVLSLMLQHNEISYRNMDGTRYQPPPDPNIAAKHGCGPAVASRDALELLTVLGLIHNGSWTQDAELVLWRKQPSAWGLEIPEDPRFHDALSVCLASLRENDADEIASLVNVTETDIADSLTKHIEWKAEQRQKYGPKARLGRTQDANAIKRSLISARGSQLDWVFFRGWRVADGWLMPRERTSALEIFHDPLAIQMRRAVVRQLHPNSDIAKAS